VEGFGVVSGLLDEQYAKGSRLGDRVGVMVAGVAGL